MIKLYANVSRKVPIPSQEYSSQSFSAGMEMEKGNDATSEEIKATLQEMYDILEESVKEQILANGVPIPVEKTVAPKEPVENENNSNGSITPNQKRFLEKLLKEQQIFGKERIALLAIKTKSEATEAIKNLIERNKQGGVRNGK
jgi:hypothetical protein